MIPRFITVEGGEGAGKSTQVKILTEYFAEIGISILRTREPGGSSGAEAIRELLLNRSGWDSTAEMTLHFAARREHWTRSIQPSLAAGSWVVCDRFFDSTLAYQVGGQGAPRATWAALRAATLSDVTPDLTLLLDMPVPVGLARAAQRGDTNRYDQLGVEFHQRIRDSFLAQAAAEPARFMVIDATASLGAVSAKIRDTCRQRFGLS